MRRVTPTVIAMFALVITACGSGSSDSLSGTNGKRDASKGSGKGTATLDGVSETLETWPVMCGLTRDGNSFVMRGGSPDGDDNPRNNVLNLSIGGEKQPRPLVSIVYNPPGDDTREESVTLTGDDAVWIDGLRFTWTGQTRSGKTLEVDIEC